PPAPAYPPGGADGGAWTPAPAVALKFDPQTLQNRASFGRLFPHFGQFIIFLSLRLVFGGSGESSFRSVVFPLLARFLRRNTVIQNNSIDEARRLDILDAARGAGDAVAIQLEPILRPGRRVEAQP